MYIIQYFIKKFKSSQANFNYKAHSKCAALPKCLIIKKIKIILKN